MINRYLQNVINYLQTVATDPFPRYIFKKEILRETPSDADVDAIHTSKWYRQLANEHLHHITPVMLKAGVIKMPAKMI